MRMPRSGMSHLHLMVSISRKKDTVHLPRDSMRT